MIMTMETTIAFKIPEEHELLKEFVRTNDGGWSKDVEANFATFTKKQMYITEGPENETNT